MGRKFGVRTIVFVLGLCFLGVVSYAQEDDGPYTAEFVEVTATGEERIPRVNSSWFLGAPVLESSYVFKPEYLPVAESSTQVNSKASPGQIIEVGKKVWEIIQAGKPVTDNDFQNRVHVLPKETEGDWNKLEFWKQPKLRHYKMSLKNGMGTEVIRFRIVLSFNHGGQYQGYGRYIANLKVVPEDVHVIWGYNLNARVLVDEQVVNVGSIKNPVAGVGVQVQWITKTVFKHSTRTVGFFLTGAGNVSVTDGSVDTDEVDNNDKNDKPNPPSDPKKSSLE